jgi:DNA-binding transcriptional LysR family regulator
LIDILSSMGQRRNAHLTPSGGKERHEPSVHQLRLFLVLADELHFGRAATRLFMTQPAFSQQIRVLEDRLGVRLVDRSSHAVELTVAGRNLLPEIRVAVEAVDRVRQLADANARELSGHLIIGAIGAEAAMPYTRAVLDELHARHPQVTVEMRGLDFVGQTAALLNDEIDAAFLRLPIPAGIQIQRLATEPRVAALCAGDPLADRPSLTLGGLAGYAVVDVPPDAPRLWWRFWAIDPRPDGSPVRYGPVVPDMEALLHAVATGQAMSFLPAAARSFFPRPGVSYIDVTDLPPCTAALAWRAKNRARPTIMALRRIAQTVAERMSEPSVGRTAAGS